MPSKCVSVNEDFLYALKEAHTLMSAPAAHVSPDTSSSGFCIYTLFVHTSTPLSADGIERLDAPEIPHRCTRQCIFVSDVSSSSFSISQLFMFSFMRLLISPIADMLAPSRLLMDTSR